MFCGFAAGKISSGSEKNKTRSLKISDFQTFTSHKKYGV